VVRTPYLPELRGRGLGRGVAPELQGIPAEAEARKLQSGRGDAEVIQPRRRSGLTNRLPMAMRMPTGSRITITNSRYGSGGISHFLTKRALGDFCSLGQVGAATMRTPVVFIVHRRLTHRQQFRGTMLDLPG